jgi:ABC-2 type transport system ATP-binding protein
MAAIEVRQLIKTFGSVVAVDGLSFEVTEGSITGFVGPNGSGKTTTLRAIVGLVFPDAGDTLVNGLPYPQMSEPSSEVGALLEGNAVHPGRSAHRHLRVLASAVGVPPERVDEVLELVGLTEHARRRVRGFSLGMRQRLGLAGALLARPRTLILDEPANGLDPDGIRWLRNLLRQHAAGGGTVLLSSHVIAELALSADRLVVIKQGRLVAQGTVAELTGGAMHRRMVRVRTPDPGLLLEALVASGIPSEIDGENVVVALGASPEQVGQVVSRSGIVVYEMQMDRPQLEDVILELTKESN